MYASLKHSTYLSGVKSAILSIIPEYSDEFVSARSHLPKPLAEMYNENHTDLEYEDLVQTAKEAFSSIAVTIDEVYTISTGFF